MVLWCRLFGHKIEKVQTKRDGQLVSLELCQRCRVEWNFPIPSKCETESHQWEEKAALQDEGSTQPKAILYVCRKCLEKQKVMLKA